MTLLPKIVTKDHTVDMNKYDYSQVEIFKGNLSARESKNFQAPKLTKVGGSLSVWKSNNLQAPKLTTVKGSLWAGQSTNFQAPKLYRVDGSLSAQNSTDFQAPKLTTVKGYLDAWNTKNFQVPKLTKVKSIHPGVYPGTESLQEIRESPLTELPVLLTKYKENSFLTDRIKARLQE